MLVAWQAWNLKYYLWRALGKSAYYAVIYVESDKDLPKLHIYDLVLVLPQLMVLFLALYEN